MRSMLLFNTFMGLVALVVAGLIGATITFLLMHLGLPKQTEECITFHDEDREDQIKEIVDWILKNAKK